MEWLENLAQPRRRNANSTIADLYGEMQFVRDQFQGNDAPRRRELHRVVEELMDHPANFLAISIRHCAIGADFQYQLQLLIPCLGLHLVDHIRAQYVEIGWVLQHGYFSLF